MPINSFIEMLNSDYYAVRSSCAAEDNINNSLVELNNVKVAFAKNEILNKYLQVTNGIKTNAPIIITSEDLTRRLQKISNITENEISQLINNWENTNSPITPTCTEGGYDVF